MTPDVELIYPFFIDCCKYTDDIFWKFVFEDLAYGKTPYGIYLTKNFLCCNYKGKEFSYKIDSKKLITIDETHHAKN